MKRSSGWLFVPLLVVLLGAAASAQDTASTLTIHADQILHPVSPTLYGLMTEEINFSYDGGMYAELVRNRAFQEHDWSGIPHWFLEGDGEASMRFDPDTGPSDALQSSLRLDIAASDSSHPVALRNEGYWGMRIDPNTVYKASLYARADTASFGPLEVALINDASGKVLASATTDPLGTQWKQYSFALRAGASATSSNNHLLITAKHSGKLWLSLVSVFPPTYHDRLNGNRADLMGMLAAMHPKFLRLPGGNFLEGDLIDQRFDWKTTLGPLVDRPTHQGPWNYQASDGLGLLEFLQWTEDLHMEPVLALYAGYSLKGDYIHPGPALRPYVDDAMDELEFVTGDTTTHWGGIRARLGHPAPFPLHFVEIGNEDQFDKSSSYDARYAQFYRAIKARFPQLQVIATTPVKGVQADVVDDHYYKRAEDFFAAVHHYDTADRNGPKVFVGEWATREGEPTTNFAAALGDAAWMTSLERNSDLIIMSCYAPLLVNVNSGGMQWASDLIGYNAGAAYGSPSYWAQTMFAGNLGDQVPASSIAAVGKRFFYSATRSAANGTLYLKLVNASAKPQALELELGGMRPAASGALLRLSATNPSETNTIADPVRVKPVETKLAIPGDHFYHEVPPFTIEVLTIPAR